jgi:hypothetical protein
MTDVEVILAKVEANVPVSVEEARTVGHSVTRTCKGPIKLGKEAEYAELRRGAGQFGEAISGYNIALVDSLNRDFCGYNFNHVIESYPFDGREHVVNCPQCKMEISFRSPYFNIKS